MLIDGSQKLEQILASYRELDTDFASRSTPLILGTDGPDNPLNGTGSGERIFALDGADRIFGGDGNDLIHGGLGDDLIAGGTGSDWALYTYLVDGSDFMSPHDDDPRTGVVVDLRIAGPQYTGWAGTDTLHGIENLLGSRGDDVLIGDDADNSIFGEGSTRFGRDVLLGQGGNDFIVPDSDGDDGDGFGSDLVDGGDGIDTVSYHESFGFLHIDLAIQGSQDFGGGVGPETIRRVENLIGSNSADGPDDLKGNSLANVIYGLRGDDTLTGRGGADILWGNGFGDPEPFETNLFVYRTIGDSTVDPMGRDRIMDFDPVTDRIDISAIDAVKGRGSPGDQAFVLGGSSFTRTAGELIQFAEDGGIVVQGDHNGDGRADFAIWLNIGAPAPEDAFIL